MLRNTNTPEINPATWRVRALSIGSHKEQMILKLCFVFIPHKMSVCRASFAPLCTSHKGMNTGVA